MTKTPRWRVGLVSFPRWRVGLVSGRPSLARRACIRPDSPGNQARSNRSTSESDCKVANNIARNVSNVLNKNITGNFAHDINNNLNHSIDHLLNGNIKDLFNKGALLKL